MQPAYPTLVITEYRIEIRVSANVVHKAIAGMEWMRFSLYIVPEEASQYQGISGIKLIITGIYTALLKSIAMLDACLR